MPKTESWRSAVPEVGVKADDAKPTEWFYRMELEIVLSMLEHTTLGPISRIEPQRDGA